MVMSAVMSLAKLAPADVEKRTAICAHAIAALGRFCSSMEYHRNYSIGTAADPSEVYSADELIDDTRAAVMFLDVDTARVVTRYLDAIDLLDDTLYPAGASDGHYGRNSTRRQLATALVVALVGYRDPSPAPEPKPASTEPKEVPF